MKESNYHRNKTIVLFGDIFILLIDLNIAPLQLITLIKEIDF